MVTMEQKKQLQIDAGIPHLPTDLTYECRIAIAGEGERAYDWNDKPHRLVYDLSRQVEADAIRIEELEKELNISRMASVTMDNTVEELDAKLTKAVEALHATDPAAIREAALREAYGVLQNWVYCCDAEDEILALIGEKK